MTEGRRSVNDIWQELQKSTAPKTSLSGFGGISYAFQRTEVKQSSKKPPSFIKSLQAKTQSTWSAESAMASLQRDVNCLSDTDRRTRMRAMESITSKLLEQPATSGAGLQLHSALEGFLLVPLVRLFADSAEKCRSLAVNFVTIAVRRLADISKMLPVLLPALVERMGSVPVEESSEEIRLALVHLVGAVVKYHCRDLVDCGSLHGIMQVLCRGLEDAYPESKKVACMAIVDLANSKCSNFLEPHLEGLLSSLLPNLQHQHSKVRLAALDSLHALVMKGCGYQLLAERAAPAVMPLVHDHAPSVRSTLFASMAGWMGDGLDIRGDSQLVNQARSCVPLFLPSLLLALTDELETIQDGAVQQVQNVAVTYGKLRPRRPDEEYDEQMLMEIDEEQWQYQGHSPCSLPGYFHPYVERPSYAAREMIKAELPRLMPVVSTGCQEWTALRRLAAARLLHAVLVHAEGKALQYLPDILQSIQTGVADSEANVAQQAASALQVLALNVGPDHWAPFAVENITAAHLSMSQRRIGLRVLSILLEATAKAGQAAQQEMVQLVAKALLHEELLAVNEDMLEASLLRAASHLLLWGKQVCCTVALPLLCLLLRIMAAERARAAAAEAGGLVGLKLGMSATGSAVPVRSGSVSSTPLLSTHDVMESLAATCNVASAVDLCNQFAPQVLAEICKKHDIWHEVSPQWRIFNSLLRCCGTPALLAGAGAILPVLSSLGASHDRDAALRESALVLVDDIFKDSIKSAAWQSGLAAAVVEKAVLPALVWRAGSAAASVRSAALKAMRTALAERHMATDDLLSLVHEARLLPLLYQCLDEDYMEDARLVACSAVTYLLQQGGCKLDTADLSTVQQEVLKRLDDSNNGIRCAACDTLVKHITLLPAHPALLDPTAVRQLISKVLVHMDDEDPQVQEAACCVLESLAAVAPDTTKECTNAALGLHRSDMYSSRVMSAC